MSGHHRNSRALLSVLQKTDVQGYHPDMFVFHRHEISLSKSLVYEVLGYNASYSYFQITNQYINVYF